MNTIVAIQFVLLLATGAIAAITYRRTNSYVPGAPDVRPGLELVRDGGHRHSLVSGGLRCRPAPSLEMT